MSFLLKATEVSSSASKHSHWTLKFPRRARWPASGGSLLLQRDQGQNKDYHYPHSRNL